MLALLMVSGLLSGAETAVFSLRPAERRRILAAGGLGQRLLRRPTDLLVCLLLGNLFINVAYFTVASGLSMELSDAGRPGAAVALGAACLIALVVAGEILPKSIALVAPARIAGWVALPVVFLRSALAPLVTLASGATQLLERLLLGSNSRSLEPDSDDYKSALSSGVALGSYRAVELALLHDVVDLGVRRARSLMVPRVDVVFLDLAQDRQAWIDTMAARPFTDYPVVNGSPDDVLGTINMAVLLTHPLVRREDLIDPPLFAPLNVAAERLVLRLLEEGRHLAILLDEYGGVAGVLGLRNLSRAILGEVEGLVASGFQRRSSGAVLVPGNCRLEVLREELGLVLPSRRSDTLSGALAEALRRLPRAGDEHEVDGWRLRVVAMRGARVETVLIRARSATAASLP